MTRKRFFTQLILLTIGIVVVLFLLSLLPVFRPYLAFSLISTGIFFLICILLFLLGVKNALSEDKNAFTRSVMVVTFAKIFVAFGVVVAFHRMTAPADNYFLIPFFFVYFAYTVFETIFLSKLGKIKAH